VNETALRVRLKRQALIIAAIRRFFSERGLVEVSTPALSPAGVSDPALANIACEVAALGGRHFLQTSPEHAMKRLLAAGSGDIWQLARVFRDGELGRWHQPEFQLLEWYRLGYDELALMDEVFTLLTSLAEPAGITLARRDFSYAQAFGSVFGLDPHSLEPGVADSLSAQLQDRGIEVPPALEKDALLDLALSALIQPTWPQDTVVFLFDYPASQAALARLKPSSPPVAARFEVFVNGVELGNGFHELTDAAEQRRRFEADLRARLAAGLEALPIDEALLEALAAGLPDCAGVALGLDRVLAVLAKADALAAVVNWPHESAPA
jgi:lysyl-tRNA synthetase class 2